MDGLIYRYYVPKEAYHPSRPPQTASPSATSRKNNSADEDTRDAPSLHNPLDKSRRARHRRDSRGRSVSGSNVADSHSLTSASDSYGMDGPRGTSGSGSDTAPSISSQGTKDESLSLYANPFELRHGRRYLRDLAYPLPCDLAETQRQNMRTMLGVAVFGAASCAPAVAKTVPKKVLEVGCGAAFWSSTCHDWFTSMGHPNVAFTGFDIAPLAPDLGRQGLDWRFVQHDLRRLPWPFEDEEFDFVMCKDMGLSVQVGMASDSFTEEMIRITSEGGTIEFWETDHVLRCLRPHPPPPPGMLKPEEELALATKTYLISPSTPFAPAQNKYTVNANAWLSKGLDLLKLPPTPCSRILNSLYQEADLTDVGVRRVAVPLSELRWEKDSLERNPLTPPKAKGKAKAGESASLLTPDQAALRYTALLTVLQAIESLEPILKEASGKNSEEWSRWWASMMASMLDQENGSSGEVLEVGSWWATKRTQ